MKIDPQKWYFIYGENLVLMRALLNQILEEIRHDAISATLLDVRLMKIRELIPEEPLEADF